MSIASAIGFVKACLDIVETHESLLLCAKSILAARLGLNTVPKVAPGYIIANNSIPTPVINPYVIDSPHHEVIF